MMYWDQLRDFLTLRYDFIAWSLIGTVLIGIACGVLGCFIILRGLSLYGDALGHATLPGIMIGYLIGGKSFAPLFVGALVVSLLASVLISWIPKVSKHRMDTAMGVIFTGFFGLGIILLAANQAGSAGVTSFLFGKALAIGPQEATWALGVFIVVVFCLITFYNPLKLMTFDPTQAVVLGLPTFWLNTLLMVLLTSAVIVSLPAIGVVLAIALLVIPGSTAFLLTQRFGVMLILAGALGGLSAWLGLGISYVWGLASGASIVLTSSVFFFAAAIYQRRQGHYRPIEAPNV